MSDMPGEPRKSQKVSPTHAARAASAEALTMGAIYSGRVKTVNINGTYTVGLDSGSVLYQVERVMPAFCSLIGLQDLTILHPGTPVLCAFGTTSFIIGTLNYDRPDVVPGRMTGGRQIAAGSPAEFPQPAAADALSGEVDLANAYSVGLRFLTTVMQMTAGDRAKIECCLLNDMVRIVSDQFHHIDPLGEVLMFDHGRPTMEKGWTAYRHELFGNKKDGETLFEEKDLFQKRVSKQGRYRLREFMGYAGDMIHSFIADPSAAIFDMAGLDKKPSSGDDPTTSSEWQAGKSWVHRAMDGSVIVQSVADIRLERVVRIPVPTRITHHEDPKLKRHYDTMQQEMQAYLKVWKTDGDYRSAFQLREYSRWLTRYSAFARFMSCEDFAVPKETDATPSPTNGEEDRAKANPAAGVFDTYAVISIQRNGSIVIFGGGASIVMTAGEMHVSCLRNLTLEAGGDLRLVAGNSIFLRARRHIELTAVAGHIVQYAYASLRLFCEAGSLVLRSTAKWLKKDDESTKPKPRFPDDRDHADEDLLPVVARDGAVVVEATRSDIGIRSYKALRLATDGTPDTTPGESVKQENDDCGVIVRSSGNLRMHAKHHTILAASKDLSLAAGGIVGSYSSGPWQINSPGVVLGGTGSSPIFLDGQSGIISASRIYADRLDVFGGIRSPRSGPQRDPELDTGGERVGDHFNHVNILPTKIILEGRPIPGLVRTSNAASHCAAAINYSISDWDAPTKGHAWGFLPVGAYQWDPGGNGRATLVETLTQQGLRLEAYDGSLTGSNAEADKVYLRWSWGGPTFSSEALNDSRNRLDKFNTFSWGSSTDAKLAHQRKNDWPSLFHPSDKDMEGYKNLVNGAKVNDSWSTDQAVSMRVYRPEPNA